MVWVECLRRLGGGGRCADLDVAATGAIKGRLSLRAVATCCAGRVQHRAAHYIMRAEVGDVTNREPPTSSISKSSLEVQSSRGLVPRLESPA